MLYFFPSCCNIHLILRNNKLCALKWHITLLFSSFWFSVESGLSASLQFSFITESVFCKLGHNITQRMISLKFHTGLSVLCTSQLFWLIYLSGITDSTKKDDSWKKAALKCSYIHFPEDGTFLPNKISTLKPNTSQENIGKLYHPENQYTSYCKCYIIFNKPLKWNGVYWLYNLAAIECVMPFLHVIISMQD